MKRFLNYFALIFGLFIAANSNALTTSNDQCTGGLADFFAGVCWDCAFPMQILGYRAIGPSGNEVQDYDSTGSLPPICTCNENLVVRTGVPVSFWEFAREVDVTKSPHCLVALGMKLPVGINSDQTGSNDQKMHKHGPYNTVFRQAHIYVNPLMGLLGLMLDAKCLEPAGFDLFWESELDPTWSDEEMARILTPDAYLFGNIVSSLACAGDCVASSTGMSGISDLLFWCAGCNGELYPLVGHAATIYGGVQMSSLLTQRVMAKMHRMLLVPTMAGADAMCGHGLPQITMDKRQYKYSMLFPIPQATPTANGPGSNGTFACCQPFGRSTLIWGAGREIPTVGEDFAYSVFRKRNCCQ